MLKRAVQTVVFFIAVLWSIAGWAQTTYRNESLESNYETLLKKVQTQLPKSEVRTAQQLAAAAFAAKDDAQLSTLLFSRAVAMEPQAWQYWLGYAFAGSKLSASKWPEREQKFELVTVAAYKAYQSAPAKEDKATALALLATAFEDRERHDDALKSLKVSLELSDNPAVRVVYEKIRAENGFRVTGYDINNASSTPRLCIRFNKALSDRKGIDWSQYVTVTGLTNIAVSRNEGQLCIEGLQFGGRYNVHVRSGILAETGDTTETPTNYEVTINDREASIRFTGTNYVLPSIGQVGIPLVSVNTSKIDVEVLRVGDRNLIHQLTGDEKNFLQQIYSYTAQSIREREGVQVWRGQLTTANDRNRDVVTAFPINEAVGKLEPGVYAMTAKIAKEESENEQSQSSDDDEDSDDDGYYGDLVSQWFIVTDLGVTAFSGQDGVHVLVKSLATGKSFGEAEVRLIARNNEVLATRRTDADGHVAFDPGLNRGKNGLAPFMVVVSTASDYAFLDLTQSAFDLTDRGVSGPQAATAMEAFLFTERGVYRTDESVHLTALLRDSRGAAILNVPLIVNVYRPDGVIYRTETVNDQGQGGRTFEIPIAAYANLGTWRVEAFTDPKQPSIGSVTFQVEDYMPERLKVVLTPKDKAVHRNDAVEVGVQADFLFGSPGANLIVKGTVKVSAESSYPGFEGYSFGLQDETYSGYSAEIEPEVITDEKGGAVLKAAIPFIDSTRPLKADITVRVYEGSGGRAVERTVSLPVLPSRPTIGIARPAHDDKSEKLNLVLLGTNGARLAASQANWVLYKVHRDYQWYRSDGRWHYEAIKRFERFRDGALDIGQTNPASLTVPTEIGYSYRFEVKASVNGVLTQSSVDFDNGWVGTATADTPDRLEVALDKMGYEDGETMKVRLVPRSANQVSLVVVSDKVYPLQSVDVPAGGTTVDIPVKSEWGANAYLVAIAHRPLDQKAQRQPGRSLGLAWFNINKSKHVLDIEIKGETLIRPNGRVSIPLTVKGVEAGSEAYVSVALVDVGILNITRYTPPDPVNHFFGQRRLSAEIRDLYGYLIDGMQGVRGAIRSGGDEMEERAKIGLAQEPLIRYSGLVKVGSNGAAQVDFDLPSFNGAAKVMAVAWSKDKVGNAAKEVIIRESLVLAGSLPRFLLIGDETRFLAQLTNVEGEAGDSTVEFNLRGPLIADADKLKQTVKLAKGGKGSVVLPIRAGGIGQAWVDAKLSGAGFETRQTFRLGILPGTPARISRVMRSVVPGESMTISKDLLQDVIYGTGVVSLTVSPVGSLDVPALLQQLDRYPHGCSEQTTSRAMPLLYFNELAAAEAGSADEGIDQRIRSAIEQVLLRQKSNGAIGLWSNDDSGDDTWLTAYVMDFLTRASERGFTVPRDKLDQALDFLRNQVANSTSRDNDSEIAYAAYVLARNGRPVMGDLRYLADNKLEQMKSPLARAQIGAALALLGDKVRGGAVFSSAMQRLAVTQTKDIDSSHYGSRLRDAATMLALSYEAFGGTEDVETLATTIETERLLADGKGYRYTSTQENAWMVMAAQAVMQKAKTMSVTINGNETKGAVFRNYRDSTLAAASVTVTNSSNAPISVSLAVTGNPIGHEPASFNGLTVHRTYYSLDGAQLDLKTVAQNDRIVAVLDVTADAKVLSSDRLLLADYLPAGLELENPNLSEEGLPTFSWLGKTSGGNNFEYRDDRYVAAFDLSHAYTARSFRFYYVVRAVSPGKYTLPPAEAEAMYRPYLNGRTGFGTLEVLPGK